MKEIKPKAWLKHLQSSLSSYLRETDSRNAGCNIYK